MNFQGHVNPSAIFCRLDLRYGGEQTALCTLKNMKNSIMMFGEIAVDECPLNALCGLREDEAAGTLNGGETNKYKYKCKTAPSLTRTQLQG